jgi:hypothetical protein
MIAQTTGAVLINQASLLESLPNNLKHEFSKEIKSNVSKVYKYKFLKKNKKYTFFYTELTTRSMGANYKAQIGWLCVRKKRLDFGKLPTNQSSSIGFAISRNNSQTYKY